MPARSPFASCEAAMQEAGFAAFAVLLLGLVSWILKYLVTKLRDSLDANTEAISALTKRNGDECELLKTLTIEMRELTRKVGELPK